MQGNVGGMTITGVPLAMIFLHPIPILQPDVLRNVLGFPESSVVAFTALVMTQLANLGTKPDTSRSWRVWKQDVDSCSPGTPHLSPPTCARCTGLPSRLIQWFSKCVLRMTSKPTEVFV